MEKSTKSSLETQKFAAALAKNIVSLREIPRSGTKEKALSGAQVFALVGELGSGKTAFTQGFAKGLGVTEKILSPTFIIMNKFALSSDRALRYLYHIDCYRLDNPAKELLHLGFKKIIADPHAIVVIEWADRIKKILPRDTLWIRFEHGDKNKRSITIW